MLNIDKRYYVGLLLVSALLCGCAKEEKGKSYEPNESTGFGDVTIVEQKTRAQEQLLEKREIKEETPEKGGDPEKKPDSESKIKVTFIELGSVKCIPCKMMQPIMKEIEGEYKGQVKVVFYDVWTSEGKPYARKYGIRVIPTQVFLDKDGNEYFRHEGFFPKDELVKVLKRQGVK